MIRDYGFRADSGGPGRFRGGCGVYRDYHLEANSSLYLWFERSVTPAWGLDGGLDAVGPDCIVNPGKDSERHLLKINALPLEAGSMVRLQTGGGGGFGHPFDRDPRLVRDDVLDGYVTVEGARRDYGVVLTASQAIDEEATRRTRLESQKKPGR
jgi:N-methylhydantoinase B